jgi:hypothetical protein
MPTLNEVAKGVLTGEKIDEMIIPTEVAKGGNSGAKGTLKPGSGSESKPFKNPGAKGDPLIDQSKEELGTGPVSHKEPTNPIGKAIARMKKDASRSSKVSGGGDSRPFANKGAKTLPLREDEDLDEDILDEDNDGDGVHMATLKGNVYKKLWEDEELDEEENAYLEGLSEEELDELKAALEEAANELDEEDEELDEEDLDEEDEELSEDDAEFLDSLSEEELDELASSLEEDEELDEAELEVDMSEHIEALFAGEELSEEFKQKAATILETAVITKLKEEIAAIEAAYEETLAEQVEEIKEEVASNVDDYMNYVVEQWTIDNEVAIESGIRSELTEDFIAGLRTLFAEHYIDIPEEKVDVVEELAARNNDLEEKLNEEIERNVELTKVVSEAVKSEIVSNMTDGLTDVQAEKLTELAESVTFADPEQFEAKVQTLKESYFTREVIVEKQEDESVSDGSNPAIIAEEGSAMEKYSNALGRSLPQ